MILTGIGDEAASQLEGQIRAIKELGWDCLEMRGVQVDGFAKANLHDLPDEAFDQTVRALEAARVRVYCFGSTIMNWSKTIEDAFEPTLGEVKRAIARMQRLGTKYVRIMSYKPADHEYRIPTEVFRRVKDITNRFLDAGLQPVHENCMNYGGMSWQHSLELLDRCPGLKWVFDTANPIFNPDRSKSKPWPRQDAWEYWQHIKNHVVHIHVKDATWNEAKNDADYNWPGEGQGRVRDIIADALARGYNGSLSIEPHMVVVFHADEPKSSDAKGMRNNFVEYGRRLQDMVALLEKSVSLPSPSATTD